MSDQEQGRVRLVREFRPDLNASTEERVAAAMEQFAIQAALIEKRLANIETKMRNAQQIMRAQLPPQTDILKSAGNRRTITGGSVPRTRPDHGYRPRQDILDRFPEVSGNAVNGLGETEWRKPPPSFWHPPDRQTHGELQHYIVSQFCPDSMEDRSFRNPTVDRGPDIVAVAETRRPGTAEDWTAAIKAFALADEADLVGITTIGPENVYEGYEITEPTAVMIGVAHDYDRLSQAPGSAENPEPYYDLHDQYNRAARVAARLTNHIREQGYNATPFLGPMGGALNMIPAAIAAGFGELGKHGSMINRTYGSGFRLSAVATDMPLIDGAPDRFGADEFCESCQVCRNACPPDAISDEKRPVRGEVKWYVDFDKCIPYFGEHLACGICIA